MLLPEDLRSSITELANTLSTQEKAKLAKLLSLHYRNNPSLGFTSDKALRIAYLITRLPATFAVLHRVLFLFYQRAPGAIDSILDLGSGPNTALFALHALGKLPSYMHCVEKDKAMQEIAKKLMSSISFNTEIFLDNKNLFEVQEKSDLVLLSYVLNEIEKKLSPSFFDYVASLSKKYLLIIEPGTPDGYERLMLLRMWALEKKWHILAPCPHTQVCPLAQSKRWCHFYTRVERTREHRLAKAGTLGFEDEKFSYLILSREKPQENGEPLLSFPKVNSGFIELDLCSKTGENKTQKIFKKEKEEYKKAKKLDWGDFF